MEPQHVQNYLDKCIDQGISKATYDQYSAALGKLDRALNLYSEKHGWDRSYDLHSGIQATRDRAQHELARFDASRAYERPGELVESISDPNHRLAGQIQREVGIRVNEVAQIRVEQLADGKLTVQGKGGKITHRELSPKTMEKLKDHISKNGQFKIDKNSYRNSIKQASEKTAQEYQGSHGLRWNYAQDRLAELNKQGESYYSSLSKISKEMGHERPDITEHYLK
jgi:integrase